MNIYLSHVDKVELAVEEKADDAHTVTMGFGDLDSTGANGCIVEALVDIVKDYYENKHPGRPIEVLCDNICCSEINTCNEEGCEEARRRRNTKPSATILVPPAVASTTGPAPERPSEAFPGFSTAMVATPTALAGLALLIEGLTSRSGSGPDYGLVPGQRGVSIFNPAYDAWRL